MKKIFALLIFTTLLNISNAQNYEFPKGWVLNLEYFNGLTTHFNSSPELYLTELRLSPQYTLVPKVLRLGAGAGLQYNNKNVSALFGPNLAIKIKTLSIEKFNSSLLNVQWVVENLWGTDKQCLIGTGLKTEIAQTLLISLTGHRDVKLDYWRFQFGLGLNLIKIKVQEIHDL